ncbi:MAG TPA: phosphomethylpyrimidine synthase, partial [Blastocatellia bacterium]|nr:phosphomethylpyrimidine synthase [Blastocatellia bacterium]
MNTSKETTSAFQFPKSQRVYVEGRRNGLRVPMREIYQQPTRGVNDVANDNPPIRVYDTTGPWGDGNTVCDVHDGITPLRRDWIVARGDVEEYEGREVAPIDDGYVTDGAREYARTKDRGRFEP